MRPDALELLAASHGVQTSYQGGDGTTHRADEDVLVAILQALGAPVASAADAVAALAERRAEEDRRHLQPVLVHRGGKSTPTAVRLPRHVHPRDVWCTVELEDGQVRRHSLSGSITAMSAQSGPPGESATYRFELEPDRVHPLPPGYHRVTVEWPGAEAHALVISAPPCPDPSRGWGAFLPLHALRTDQDWGIGGYADLAELGRWIGDLGGSMVGALPLYPAFLDPPADPSPYLPVSRLAYNEIFVDPTSLPEATRSAEAQRLLASDEFRRRLALVHDAALVDYEDISRLRRDVLSLMATTLLAEASSRRDELCHFAEQHPELLAYARFRADLDARTADSGAPARDRSATVGYHLYAQWAAAQQLASAASATPLYADLPVGVHPRGFDPRWAPDDFVAGVSGGAPPDLFFEGGQDWSFPPLHPQRMREDGYRYFIEILRRAFRHASYLRVDHVMGLQRLYWIPNGFDARHGAYVSYRADELHALVSLEAHRADSVVVGEDLGTVPAGVRARMAEDHMLRSWVLQFESSADVPLPTPPVSAMASWGTHDLARFGAYFRGDDIDEDERTGRLSEAEAASQRATREAWRAALLAAIGTEEDATSSSAGAGDPAAALRGCLAHLARSPADLVMVDLEELWGERQPQNRPGTGPEASNWRRRASHTLEEAREDVETVAFLGALHELRQVGPTDRLVVHR